MVDQQGGFLAVAVQRYADACRPPLALHPDCPFAVTDDEGARSCERECLDVLLRLRRPGISAPSGFSPTNFFDARRHVLSESGDEPMSHWHTASLMVTLHRELNSPPAAPDGTFLIRREIAITNSLTHLARRGYDIERLVREGFRDSLPGAVAFWVARARLVQDFALTGDLTRWKTALDDAVGAIVEEDSIGSLLVSMSASNFAAFTRRWLASAPLPDIINWRVSSDVDGEAVEDDGLFRWLVERFSVTYLDRWSLQSLKHEYRYARGEEIPGVPTPDLQGRFVDSSDVARHLADRTLESDASRLAEVIRQALSLLEEGRRLEAAALFDAARLMDQWDPHAHNNYAFCVMLDDPKAALDAIDQGVRRDTEPFALSRVNRTVVLSRLDREEEALATAEETFRESESDLAALKAYLWDLSDVEAPVIALVDALPYLCERASEIAARIGDDSRTQTWRERHQAALAG